jgi:hypothetical protein
MSFVWIFKKIVKSIIPIQIKSLLNKIYFEKYVFNQGTVEKRMTRIYKSNYWGNKESVSGPGSTLVSTQGLILQLPLLIKRLKIQSIFDAPCGDFNWMKRVLEDLDIRYLGGDIVQDLIDINTKKYSSDQVKFQQFNISQDKFPYSDLWLSRHIFFHLSFHDIAGALENFLESKSTYILTTNSLVEDNYINRDIESGGWRPVDLFGAPFNFPTQVLATIQDYAPPASPTNLILLHRDQLITPVQELREKI